MSDNTPIEPNPTPTPEPTPDPLAPVGSPAESDAEVLIGGPGQSETAVEVKVGEHSYMVEPEIAAALAAQKAAAPVAPAPAPAPTSTPVGGTLEDLISGESAPVVAGTAPVVVDDAAINDDFSQRLWENPKALFEEAKAEVKREIRQEMTAQASAASNTDKFWNDFYTTHTDLTRDDKLIVEGIVTRHFDEVIKLPPTDAMSRIADLSRQELLRIRGGSPASTGEQPPVRTDIESGSGGGTTPTTPAADEGEEQPGKAPGGSLSSMLAKRAAKRVAAG